MEIKAIETIYNGYKFRSRLEARWAYFFDLLGIDYEYELEGLDEEKQYYLPDFYLPFFNVFFEVKRKGLTNQEKIEAIKKISYGSHSNNEFAGLICFGDPEDNDLMLFCHEYTDSGGGSAEFRVEFGVSDEGNFTLIRIDDHKDRETLTDSMGMKTIPTERSDYAAVPDFFINARLKARQVQFEHGSAPLPPRKKTRDMQKRNASNYLLHKGGQNAGNIL